LKKQDVYIPNDDQISSPINWWQQYNYDSLNRLSWAREISSGGTELWKQAYDYDRYGNRTINQAGTYGTGINKKDFTVNIANNRLGIPGGQSGTMTFDSAGNLTVDTYSAAAGAALIRWGKPHDEGDTTKQCRRRRIHLQRRRPACAKESQRRRDLAGLRFRWRVAGGVRSKRRSRITAERIRISQWPVAGNGGRYDRLGHSACLAR
jgi:hypothetical protein